MKITFIASALLSVFAAANNHIPAEIAFGFLATWAFMLD
jgi:hypothetical protein